MTNPEAARLNYLNNAAHLLAFRSPTTAAFLQARINHLASGEIALDAVFAPGDASGARDSLLPLPKNRHLDTCASCGFTLTSQRLHLETRVPRRQKQTDHEFKQCVKRLHVKCSQCGATTHQSLTRLESVEKHVETRRAVKTEKSPAVSSKSSPALNPENNITPKTSRACSRKRVQARKGSSLSAMLAKSKQDATSSNSGFGFDLMDLMKST